MNKHRLYIVGKAGVCILFILSVLSAATSCAETRQIAPAQWQQLTSDRAFSYANDREAVQHIKNYNTGPLSKFFAELIRFIGSDAGLFLAWMLAIAIVIFIINKVVIQNSNIFRRRKRKTHDTVSEQPEAEDVLTTDWETLQQEAIKNNNTRLAVRYSYMRVLQLLQQNGLIQYQNDKTNYEYYSELNDPKFKQPFRQLSRQYEYAWYGHYDLQPEVYNAYLTLFTHFKRKLGS